MLYTRITSGLHSPGHEYIGKRLHTDIRISAVNTNTVRSSRSHFELSFCDCYSVNPLTTEGLEKRS